MTSALLEKSLSAFDTLIKWDAKRKLILPYFVRDPVHEVQKELRDELAKPAPYDQTALELCETCGWKTLIPGEGCLNCERSTQPAWHDAPTGPGLWVNMSRGWVDAMDVRMPSAWQNTGARWFGPIPEDQVTDKELTRYNKPCPDLPRGQCCHVCGQSYVCLHPDRKKEGAPEDVKPLP